jgi:hypothetical protein
LARTNPRFTKYINNLGRKAPIPVTRQMPYAAISIRSKILTRNNLLWLIELARTIPAGILLPIPIPKAILRLLETKLAARQLIFSAFFGR